MNKIARRNFIQKLAISSLTLAAPLKDLFEPITFNDQIRVKGLLMHMSHYDSKWNPSKEYEETFSVEVGLEVLEAMKKSGRNQHDKWMYPYWDLRNFVAREEEYFSVALDLIDEIIQECKPGRYFHIGMDEDHHRSLDQYVRTIRFFHNHLKDNQLKTVIWSDTAYENRNVIAQVHADKSRAAEPLIPKDIVQVLWDYDLVHNGIIQRLSDQGFEVWMAPGRDRNMIRDWKKVVIKEGGNGLLLSNWIKCSEKNRDTILRHVQEFGPEYS